MKTRFTAMFLVMLAAFYFAPHGFMQTQIATQSEAPKFALLVGINRYKKFKDININIRDLRGTHNDVGLMKNLLAEYGFKEDAAGAANDKFPCGQQTANSNVKTLCSEQATQAAIRENFKKQLIDNAKNYFVVNKMTASDRDKGANVVFYYSGHGSKLEDKNGDESDGIDETIVAQDSDRNGARDIPDDDFDTFYKELSQYTTNITFMFDSCHSGTVTRGGSPKSVERNFPTKNNSRGGNPTLSDGISVGANSNYVTISGSLPTQESQEDIFIDPTTKEEKWDGALTYNFVNLLRQNPDLTYREIINLMRPAVAKFNQTPQVEGDIDRRVFGSSATRGEVSLAIVGTPQKIKKTFENQEIEVNEINLAVGSIVGAGKGAAIAVFGTKAGDKTRQQIGSGIITAAGDFTSTAEVSLFDANMKEIAADATIKIISPNFNKDDKQMVALDVAAGSKGAGESKVLSDIEEKLKTNALLKTVRMPNLLNSVSQSRSANSEKSAEKSIDWDVAVVRGTYKDFKFGNVQPDISKITKSGKGGADDSCRQIKFVGDKAVAPADTEQGFFLIGKADKMPLYNLWLAADNANAGKCLADALEKHARIENLRNLTSGGSNLNDNIKVEVVRLDSMDNINRDLAKCNAEKNTLAVKTDGDERKQFKPNDLYYLKITNASERDLFLYIYSLTTGGAINLIYPVEGAASGEKLPAGRTICTIQKEILFQIDSPEVSPFGVETLKIIATKQDFPANLLSQPAIASRGSGSPLEQLLRHASTGKRSGAVSFAVSDWATKNINIEIVP
ncbi:MAG: caspase family protein [Pyrinomonadaceae bacterium]|nr:caspase family protein [Pyrinomonadaceae bacterium]